jgi:uncharacterized protein DUF6194
MTTDLPFGPTPEDITKYILETYPETDVAEAYAAWFFSLDAEKHFPNFATIVTTDDHDDASDLSRPGVFRLNIGVDRQTFERVATSDAESDYTAYDRLLPHPVYARQLWICILNPSEETFSRPSSRRLPSPTTGSRRRGQGIAARRRASSMRVRQRYRCNTLRGCRSAQRLIGGGERLPHCPRGRQGDAVCHRQRA